MTTDDTPNDNAPIRNGKGQYVRTLENAERDAKCARLYSSGDWTFQAIADHLGYHDKSCAIRGYQRAVREAVQGAGEAALRINIDRLEYLYEKAVEILETDHVVVSHGKVVTMLDPASGEEKPLIDSGPKLAAIREARSSMESFRRLTGLDQPSKLNLSGGVKYEVVGVDPEELT